MVRRYSGSTHFYPPQALPRGDKADIYGSGPGGILPREHLHASPSLDLDRTTCFVTSPNDSAEWLTPSRACDDIHDTAGRGKSFRLKAPHSKRQALGTPSHSVNANGRHRNTYWIVAGLLLSLVTVGAVVGGVVGTRPSLKSAQNSQGSIPLNPSEGSSDNPLAGEGSSHLQPGAGQTTGGNGTAITTRNGQTFLYQNNFGGHWVATPFDDSARPNSWTPPLNASWNYETMRQYGVNTGGWLVTEPFIVPALYEPYEDDAVPAIDEYTLMLKYGNNATARMREHYESFITEEDFAAMAGAGLNWVRIPLGFWAVQTIEGEPFVEGLSWQYFLEAVSWARKYGLRIILGLHCLPGSQNTWNHSGKQGAVNFLNGTMGIANAQRSLSIIRTLTQFIVQPEYANVIPMFSIVNEPQSGNIGQDILSEFYYEAYRIIREVTGTGEGKGPWIVISDGFEGLDAWHGFMRGADRVAMDRHNYLGFAEPSNDGVTYSAAKPCDYWAEGFNTSMVEFGLTISGEWSLAINDCGQYLNDVGNGNRYEGTWLDPNTGSTPYVGVGSCESWNDWQSWRQETRDGLSNVALASMDAAQNWFFWTWKIGRSSRTGIAPNPMWHMRLGLERGWFPRDPRQAAGICRRVVAEQGFPALSVNTTFTSFPEPWMTGGLGAGNLAQAQLIRYGTWPPTSIREPIGTRATNLPTYTATGTPIAMFTSMPTITATIIRGSNWGKLNETAGFYVPVAGCSYPAPYEGVNAPIPTARCRGA